MAKIIKDREIIEDSWAHLSDDDGLVDGNFTVSFGRWQEEKDVLRQHSAGVGVRLTGEDPLEDIVPDLGYFQLIALQFPAFTDGRCYSYARLLRDRYDYTGEVRAQGDVLYDQLFFMLQCGFNSFELAEPKQLDIALKAFEDFSESYQTTVLRPEPLYRRR